MIASDPLFRIRDTRLAPKRKRLLKDLKGKPMTIAIGMLCQGGVVVAADTQMTWPDGTTYDATKIQSTSTPTLAIAIAYTCLDMNAAESLVRNLIRDVEMASPRSPSGLEDIIGSRMEAWSKTYIVHNDRPDVSLIVAARLTDPSLNGTTEFRLYFCEPPGTIVQKTIENSSGYVAAGAGMIVTDPLFRTIFGPLVSPRRCLGQLSYLMYRAKKDCRGACGGRTDAVLITEEHSAPLWIEWVHLKHAELRGKLLDETLAKVASALMARNNSDDVSGFKGVLDAYHGQLANLFIARTGEVIRDEP